MLGGQGGIVGVEESGGGQLGQGFGDSVPDASSVTRIMQQVGGSFGTAMLAVILVGHSFQATFWWSVAFTALALLPAAMLPRRAAARE